MLDSLNVNYLSVPVDYSITGNLMHLHLYLGSITPQSTCFLRAPITLEESQAMVKLSQIWNSVPNCKISSSERSNKKTMLLNSVTLQQIQNSMSSICSRYSENMNNPYYIALAISRDIYDSIKNRDAKQSANVSLNLKSIASTPDENSCLSKDSTGSSNSNKKKENNKENKYHLSQNVTFSEITNQVNAKILQMNQ